MVLVIASAEGPKAVSPTTDRLIVPAPPLKRLGANPMVSAPLPVWPRSVVPSLLAARIASRSVTRPSPATVLSARLLTVRIAGTVRSSRTSTRRWPAPRAGRRRPLLLPCFSPNLRALSFLTQFRQLKMLVFRLVMYRSYRQETVGGRPLPDW